MSSAIVIKVLKNRLQTIDKEIEREERKILAKAASYLARKVRKKIENTFSNLVKEKGHLIKSIKIRYGKTKKDDSPSYIVGPVGNKGDRNSPYYYAPAFEFGSDGRKTKKGKRNPLPKKPFLFTTCAEESNKVRQIVSEIRYLK